jgi:predicted TIM-barrel fold metal-dependent hydrolase
LPRENRKQALPIDIDGAARGFPELKINAFHTGYPFCKDHGYPAGFLDS